MEKKTLIINLFGAPGAGKSTAAAWIFAKLKAAGVDAELVTEYAKDRVWEGNLDVFNCQFYITGKQVWKIARCIGKVDVIVTDSPLRGGKIYAQLHGQNKLADAVTEQADIYEKQSLNFFLNRAAEYQPNGRNQTEEESNEIASKMKEELLKDGIKFLEFEGTSSSYDRITEYILNVISTN